MNVAPEAFAAVIARLPGATLLVASDGVIRDANAPAQEMLQRSPDELRGLNLSEVIAEPAEKLAAFLRASSRSANPVPAGMTLAAAGQRIACRWEGSVLALRTPEAPALLMVRVVPNEVAVNRFAALNSRIEELGKEVARRRLAEIALREQRELLAEADRRKDEFLAMLAHELRNPLAVLGNGIQYIRGAQRAVAEDPALGLLGEAMQRQLRQLARLVDDLLDVSRISTGKIVLRQAPVALQDVIQESIATCRPAIGAREIRMRVALPAERLLVDADPARLSQVFCNLISNAVKFSEPGSQVEIASEALAGRAVVRVRDSGAGIAAELLDSVFDLFVQGDKSLERTQGGLGVGLTIARQITELHGGSIEARSAGTGRGSEFLVSLPLTQARVSPPRERDADAPSPPAKARRVLVVDDNVDAAASLAMLLRMAGHSVEIANDGGSALVLSTAQRPDVVLLDLGMPGMDGYEVARRMRANPSNEGVLLLALSGYGAEADRKESRASGFDHHLTKPVQIEALHDLISQGRAA